jgi:Uma2 family endonuclease
MPMSTADVPRGQIEAVYAEYAREYLRNLPLEHFMEATAQGRQREITLESLALVKARRSDVHVFNELLIQYPRPRQKRPGQVVPDNMVVIYPGVIEAEGSYDIPVQPVGPFWTLEYVSKSSKRKDYDGSLRKYERDLKVPYCLMFYPDAQELTLYQRGPRKYRAVPPNGQDHYPIAELEMEVGLLDSWVRFWFRGELLPLPGDLQHALDETRQQLEAERLLAARERQRAEQADQRADEAARQIAETRRRLEEEQQARQALERALAQLRARPPQPP